jgi:hypothetical protein
MISFDWMNRKEKSKPLARQSECRLIEGTFTHDENEQLRSDMEPDVSNSWHSKTHRRPTARN